MERKEIGWREIVQFYAKNKFYWVYRPLKKHIPAPFIVILDHLVYNNFV